ncbi:MAG: IclR family transcriptional regulator [Roseovarius sp.]
MNPTDNTPATDVDQRLYVASIERTMRVLEVFDGGRDQLTIGDVTDRTGLGRSAVQRMMYTLEKLGYLSREPDGRHYGLTLKILDFTAGMTGPDSLARRVSPILATLLETTGETASWVRLEGEAIVILQTLCSRHLGHVAFQQGQRFPALPSSSGQAILAFQDPAVARRLFDEASPEIRARLPFATAAEMAERFEQTRRSGHAVTAKEEDLFSVSISAPVVSGSGTVWGAFNISALESRVPRDRVGELLAGPLHDAVAQAKKLFETQTRSGLVTP